MLDFGQRARWATAIFRSRWTIKVKNQRRIINSVDNQSSRRHSRSLALKVAHSSICQSAAKVPVPLCSFKIVVRCNPLEFSELSFRYLKRSRAGDYFRQRRRGNLHETWTSRVRQSVAVEENKKLTASSLAHSCPEIWNLRPCFLPVSLSHSIKKP